MQPLRLIYLLIGFRFPIFSLRWHCPLLLLSLRLASAAAVADTQAGGTQPVVVLHPLVP
jgi:hypothetical protein